MTLRFRDLPIRRKLVIMTVASTAVALLLAGGGFLAWDLLTFRGEIQNDLTAQARILSENSAASLVFNDDDTGFATVATLLVVCTLVAVVVGARLQRSIADPLLALASVARRVSDTRDYGLRAVPLSADEVGVVVHAFNDMLDRIGERSAELSANADLQREIEERKRMEVERSMLLARERDANRLKDEFLATLSHELRTPLNAVLGWTRVLRATTMPPETQARALESIERNARAQARLIEDLLEVSRIVTGRLRLQVRPSDLAAIVDAAVEVVQPAAAAKRIRITSEITARPAMTSGTRTASSRSSGTCCRTR